MDESTKEEVMKYLIILFVVLYLTIVCKALFREHDGVYYNCLYAKGNPLAEKACNK